MARTGKCFSLVRGRVLRATRLDGCGNRVTGAGCNAIVSEGFISVGLTANISEGEPISVPNAAGKICVQDTPAPEFTGYGVEMTFCEVDPELYAMLTGQDAVYNSAGVATGFRVSTDKSASDTGFALELWSTVPGGGACAGGATGSYGYLLLPFLQGGVIGDFSIENAAVTFTISGAQTKDGSNWGVGPYNVLPTGAPDGQGNPAPGPLATPIGASDHLHVEMTGVAPPTPDCGCLDTP